MSKTCERCEVEKGTVQCVECAGQSASELDPVTLCNTCSGLVHTGPRMARHSLVPVCSQEMKEELKRRLDGNFREELHTRSIIKEMEALKASSEIMLKVTERELREVIVALQLELKDRGKQCLDTLNQQNQDRHKGLYSCFDSLNLKIDLLLKERTQMEDLLKRGGQLVLEDMKEISSGPCSEAWCSPEQKLELVKLQEGLDFRLDVSAVKAAIQSLDVRFCAEDSSDKKESAEGTEDWKSIDLPNIHVEAGAKMTGAVTCRMMADGTFWLIPDIPNSTVFESLDILSNQIRLRRILDACWQTFGESSTMPSVGQELFAQYMADHRWYRAYVEDVKIEYGKVNIGVRFMDYGNYQVCSVDKLLPKHEDLATNFPRQALECTLMKTPQVDVARDIRWTFSDYVYNAELHCTFIEQIEIKERKVWYIEIEVEYEGQIVVINPIIQEKAETGSAAKSTIQCRDIRYANVAPGSVPGSSIHYLSPKRPQNTESGVELIEGRKLELDTPNSGDGSGDIKESTEKTKLPIEGISGLPFPPLPQRPVKKEGNKDTVCEKSKANIGVDGNDTLKSVTVTPQAEEQAVVDSSGTEIKNVLENIISTVIAEVTNPDTLAESNNSSEAADVHLSVEGTLKLVDNQTEERVSVFREASENKDLSSAAEILQTTSSMSATCIGATRLTAVMDNDINDVNELSEPSFEHNITDNISDLCVPDITNTEPELCAPDITNTESDLCAPNITKTEPESSVPDITNTESDIRQVCVPDITNTESDLCVPDITKTEPELSVPDNTNKEPELCAPDITNTEPALCVPDITNTETDFCVPDITNTESDLFVPDITNTEPALSVPDITNTESDLCVPDITNTESVCLPNDLTAHNLSSLVEKNIDISPICDPQIVQVSDEPCPSPSALSDIKDNEEVIAAPEEVNSSDHVTFTAVSADLTEHKPDSQNDVPNDDEKSNCNNYCAISKSNDVSNSLTVIGETNDLIADVVMTASSENKRIVNSPAVVSREHIEYVSVVSDTASLYKPPTPPDCERKCDLSFVSTETEASAAPQMCQFPTSDESIDVTTSELNSGSEGLKENLTDIIREAPSSHDEAVHNGEEVIVIGDIIEDKQSIVSQDVQAIDQSNVCEETRTNIQVPVVEFSTDIWEESSPPTQTKERKERKLSAPGEKADKERKNSHTNEKKEEKHIAECMPQRKIYEGAEFEAMVCVSIDSSGRFWLQLARDKAGDNAFNFFKKQLHTYSPLAASIVNPSNHNMVLHIDGRGDWYRCKITQIQDNKVTVQKVDHGGIITVPVATLKAMPDKLQQLAHQAIYCGLSTTEYREFNPDACHLFEKLTKNKVLHITVLKMESQNFVYVRLVDKSTDPPTNIYDEILKKVPPKISHSPPAESHVVLQGYLNNGSPLSMPITSVSLPTVQHMGQIPTGVMAMPQSSLSYMPIHYPGMPGQPMPPYTMIPPPDVVQIPISMPPPTSPSSNSYTGDNGMQSVNYQEEEDTQYAPPSHTQGQRQGAWLRQASSGPSGRRMGATLPSYDGDKGHKRGNNSRSTNPCSICNQLGHWKSECPQRQHKSDGRGSHRKGRSGRHQWN